MPGLTMVDQRSDLSNLPHLGARTCKGLHAYAALVAESRSDEYTLQKQGWGEADFGKI